MSKKPSKEQTKTLVLCVDRDNDVGAKAQIKTPIIGEDPNLEAASKLALSDPEEADANAIFGAVKTYRSLVAEAKNKEEYQVATIVGSELGGVQADKKLLKELDEVLESFSSDGVILVSDGAADESVIPIIQSRVPIVSIKRVVIRQSEAIEGSWLLFSRYLKKLSEDPYYAKIALGIPGVIMIVLSALWYYDLLLYASMVTLFIIGAVFVLKGFGFDKRLSKLSLPDTLPGQIELLTTIAAILLLSVDIYQAFSAFNLAISASFFELLGLIMNRTIDLAVIATCLVFIGRVIAYYLTSDQRMWRNITITVTVAWLRDVVYKASAVLLSPVAPTSIWDPLIINLLSSILLGFSIAVLLIFVTSRLSRMYAHRFKRYVRGKIEKH
jgi:putative membrane protein